MYINIYSINNSDYHNKLIHMYICTYSSMVIYKCTYTKILAVRDSNYYYCFAFSICFAICVCRSCTFDIHVMRSSHVKYINVKALCVYMYGCIHISMYVYLIIWGTKWPKWFKNMWMLITTLEARQLYVAITSYQTITLISWSYIFVAMATCFIYSCIHHELKKDHVLLRWRL